MHTPPKRITAAITASIVLLSMPAQAGLNDALEGMFMSNSTSPGAYQSQTRGGLVGGSMSLRTPIRSVNLVALDPVRVNAGCGGIDMYGGSFSFINSDQLVALFRQIAANAVGAAFKMAIKSISPQIDAVMTEFQNRVQYLNGLMKNSCQLGTQLAETASTSLGRKSVADEQAGNVATVRGVVADKFKSLDELFGYPNKTVTDQASFIDASGNIVWKALTDSGAAAMLGNPLLPQQANEPTSKELVMSLLGTVLYPAADTSYAGADHTLIDPGVGPIEPSLSLFDLRNGSGPADGQTRTPRKILQCNRSKDMSRNGCTDINKDATFVFDGTVGYANKMLFGDASASSASSGAVTGGLVGKLAACKSQDCGFTAEERRFINSINAPVLKFLRDVQFNPGAMAQVAQLLAPIIADDLALRYADATIAVANRIFSGWKGDKPKEIAARQDQLLREMNLMRQIEIEQVPRMNAAKEFIATMVKTNPASVYRLAR